MQKSGRTEKGEIGPMNSKWTRTLRTSVQETGYRHIYFSSKSAEVRYKQPVMEPAIIDAEKSAAHSRMRQRVD
jgi:hypothetical protein